MQVFSLPSRERIFSGTLPFHDTTFKFAGLAADPAGSALIVGGTNDTPEVRVFAWPLDIPGFPLLH